MSPSCAVLNETRRSFDLRGRTARGNYLRFLLVAVLLFGISVALCIALLPEGRAVTGIYVTTAIFYLPVTAAGVRRLHDVGESGALMLMPLMPAAAVGLALLALGFGYEHSNTVTLVTVLSAMFFAEIVYALVVVVLVSATVMTLMHFSNTMGLLLLPSQPGPNSYGPNPNEVQK